MSSVSLTPKNYCRLAVATLNSIAWVRVAGCGVVGTTNMDSQPPAKARSTDGIFFRTKYVTTQCIESDEFDNSGRDR